MNRLFFCPNSTQVHSSKILWKWVSAFWKWVLDFWKWVSGILEMSFDIFYWKFYIWDWIFNFLLKFQDFCKWKFVKTVIMYEFLAFLTQLITFKRWKHVKIAEKIGFPVFGNEFHHLGNEFHHFFGNEFRSNRAKKACTLVHFGDCVSGWQIWLEKIPAGHIFPLSNLGT